MYFDSCKNLNELKAEYRKLCMLNHPDLGGDTETMQYINAEYDRRFKVLQREFNVEQEREGKDASTETPEEFREILDSLIHMKGLEIELCGSWLWIGGETLEWRESLKELGCKWSKGKRRWYWHPKGQGHWYRGHRRMDDIRAKYGSQTFKVDERELLTA